MYAFCERHGIAHERCGKLIVARDASELPKLDELERRGRENGVPDLRRVDADGLREIEPHARGVAALHSPATGIVDFADVARALAARARRARRPGRHRLRRRGRRAAQADGSRCATRRAETRARFAVFCAGGALGPAGGAGRRLARPAHRPLPRRLPAPAPERRDLVKGLIYPVPDPSLPFLGVHLSRHIDGEVSLGPTALLAPGRHLPRTLAWPGTWRMARRWWRTGLTELQPRRQPPLARPRRGRVRAGDRAAGDFTSGFAGVRAQALGRDGKLVDDFVISDTERALHVRNAPSPAATSSLALARLIADRVERARDARAGRRLGLAPQQRSRSAAARPRRARARRRAPSRRARRRSRAARPRRGRSGRAPAAARSARRRAPRPASRRAASARRASSPSGTPGARRGRRAAGTGTRAANGIAVPSAGPSSPSDGVSASDSTTFATATATMMRAASRARPAPTRKPGVTTSAP